MHATKQLGHQFHGLHVYQSRAKSPVKLFIICIDDGLLLFHTRIRRQTFRSSLIELLAMLRTASYGNEVGARRRFAYSNWGLRFQRHNLRYPPALVMQRGPGPCRAPAL
jgi:hypothetical protein